ncbi:unnamed protein product [Microthlaspi erraticum]|uniref:FBD domain-containing protein n=1 Tax=Microthlaspi erraticum TaxID=1685480 RepID=A0A6D2HJG7_9BRAS|nr:unnamed protein product [Microthlaspi erraticum]
MENSLVSPQEHRFNVQLRQAMRLKIFAILQRKMEIHGIRTKLLSLSCFLEMKLMNLAKSEEEYSDLRDLEVRVDHVLNELKDQRCGMRNVSDGGINALPDSLLTQILLWLPTKVSARTSVLSSRWRNLWLHVPGLELDFSNFLSLPRGGINNLVDRFMESRLQKLKIKYFDCNASLYRISKLIATVVSRGVEHLAVESSPRFRDTSSFMPLDIYKSKTLVSLKLAYVGMENPGFVISLPCLRSMHLESIIYSNGDPLIIENLISGCAVLEDLEVCWGGSDDNLLVLRVRSQSLKRFSVRSSPLRISSGREYAVEIDAPGLKYINFRDEQSDRVVVKNLSSLFMIDIDAKLNVEKMKNGVISGFLGGVSGVRHMIISQPTLEVLHPYFKQGTIKFLYLFRLEASFCNLLLQVLPDFLESFPNLKHLTLCLVYTKELEPEALELTIVPKCLLSSALECVEIREVTTGGGETGKKRARNGKRTVLMHKKRIWMEAVRYVLENSLLLKKLVLCFSPKTIKASEISKSLDTFTKRSPKCEILIRWTPL